jgi:hypothetical protein
VQFFRKELIALLNEKRFNMGDFADYQRFDEIEHLEGSSNVQCFTSGSASVYVPWTVHSAAAIVNSLKVLSQYFAIHPMSCMEMNHNILLDVSERANVLQDSVSFKVSRWCDNNLEKVGSLLWFEEYRLCLLENVGIPPSIFHPYGIDEWFWNVVRGLFPSCLSKKQ